jgi:hypothetical protein
MVVFIKESKLKRRVILYAILLITSISGYADLLIAGQNISGVLITQVTLNQNACSKDEAVPVLIRYTNKDLEGCVSGVDVSRVDWQTQRIYINPNKISCDNAEYKIKGYIVGSDNKAGVKGKLLQPNEMTINAGTKINLILTEQLKLKNSDKHQ